MHIFVTLDIVNFDNNPELFNEHYGYIVKCVWNSITIDEIIDMLSSCSYLYEIERYRPISELITSHYLVPLDQFSPPHGIRDSDKAKLFCHGLGNFYARQKEYEKSLRCYEKALEIKPDYFQAWNNKGTVFLNNLGRYEEAIACFDKALELNPSFADVWNNKGTALNDLNRHEEAIQCFDKAIEIKPDFVEAGYNKGTVLLNNLGKNEEAIQCFDKAIEINPNYASAWYNTACSKVKKGDIEDGLADLMKAIELDKMFIELAKQDKDFESIRNDQRFKALVG